MLFIFEPMKKGLLAICLFFAYSVSAQLNFGIATGISVLHNLSPQQKFWAAGQTIHGLLHFSAKHSLYASIDYYTKGKFTNQFNATAKSAGTAPQQIDFLVTGRPSFRQMSIGWKHYFKGRYDSETGINLYAQAGFGLLFSQMENDFSTNIDTAQYHVPLQPGEGNFRKLSFDLGFGAEYTLGGNFFVFADTRTWLPASGYPSPYLHNQKNVPLSVMLSVGFRVLIGMRNY